MFRQFLLFLFATVITTLVGLIDGSAAVVMAGTGRLALVLFLFLPIFRAAANILKGPPPI